MEDNRREHPQTYRNAYTIANAREMVTRDRVRSLSFNKEEIPQLSVEISRRGSSALTHGHSHHPKTLSKLVKIFPVLFIAFFSFQIRKLPSREEIPRF
jgi:hypothetical protein